MTINEIKKVEHLVNQKIRENLTADIKVTTPEQATKEGALAFFGEKYGEKVRVLTYGDFSKELCGGTHVAHTGVIGFFKIISETGIAAGIRRLEAVTGEGALNWIDSLDDQIREAAKILKTGRDTLLDKLQKNIEYAQQLEKQLEKMQNQLAKSLADDLIKQAKEINGTKVLITEVKDIDPKKLRELMDQLKDKLKSSIIVLGMNADQRAQLVVGVSKDLSDKIKANELINEIAPAVGGKGGGRPDMAQAGGDKPEQLGTALQHAFEMIEKQLK